MTTKFCDFSFSFSEKLMPDSSLGTLLEMNLYYEATILTAAEDNFYPLSCQYFFS